MVTRKQFLGRAALAVGLATIPKTLQAETAPGTTSPGVSPSPSGNNQPPWQKPAMAPGEPGEDYRPTITLNGSTMPYKVVDGVKVFHLICEEVDHVFVPETPDNQELRAYCWGFNGRVHGPTIECVEGDRVRIYVTNNCTAMQLYQIGQNI